MTPDSDMTTVAEFLLERIAEDEAEARRIPDDWVEPYDQPLRWHDDDVLSISPARVLAECEAKRRIVERATAARDAADDEVLRDLASVYADHPDFDLAWRP